MFDQGQVISYLEMCNEEGVSLQRGMNFRLKGGFSVFLMSRRKSARYPDRVEENGRILVYEGHDIPKKGDINPKHYDQVVFTEKGGITQNGLFYQAAHRYLEKKTTPEKIRVYEKISQGIWVYNGLFLLIDAWQEKSKERFVYKFKLEVSDHEFDHNNPIIKPLEHNRIIPSDIKISVWKRDKGRCVKCGSMENLHFDHIIPYSKGGTSLIQDNIQLLCARHNLEKSNKIE